MQRKRTVLGKSWKGRQKKMFIGHIRNNLLFSTYTFGDMIAFEEKHIYDVSYNDQKFIVKCFVLYPKISKLKYFSYRPKQIDTINTPHKYSCGR
jgi:hypothetical protein